MLKQYCGISLDFSASMQPNAALAMKDYNTLVGDLVQGQTDHDIDTVASVVQCGVAPSQISGGYLVNRMITNSNVLRLKPLTSYQANGDGTPLWDSIGDLIQTMSMVPDASDPSVSFLVIAISDGLENRSTKWSGERLRNKIAELQATDRWSFALRVPVGYKKALVAKLGVPEYNVLEWGQTEKGFTEATRATTSAVAQYYDQRSKGATSTTRFYADLSVKSSATIKKVLTSVPVGSYYVHNVPADCMRMEIRDFVEQRCRLRYYIGSTFYQLTKTETIQPQKIIAIMETDGKLYKGASARDLLGIPHDGNVKVVPGNFAGRKVFIQSTSTNRHLMGDTQIIYFKEGKL